MTAPLLELRELAVGYGRVEALHHVTLEVRAGEIVTVIGPNGAGKTTLLAAAMGLLPAAGTLLTLQGIAEVLRCVLCLKEGQWPARLHDVEELEQLLQKTHQTETADQQGVRA